MQIRALEMGFGAFRLSGLRCGAWDYCKRWGFSVQRLLDSDMLARRAMHM